jgi:LCP family protein required for cell wall assembly
VAGLFEEYDPPAEPPPTAIPTRMPMADNLGSDIINVLLMGLDTHPDRTGSRSDTIIVVSINRSTATVNMLSFPRDMFVYIPGWTMQRLNTAASRGDVVDWRGGGGPALLRDALLYNFGIPIHFYARVDFDGFRRLIDIVGGIDVPVDCTHQDWILKEPGLDEQDEDNWELYTLPIGVQRLDGHHALWYARSRRRTSDFDRSRRQQMILRALFSKARAEGLLSPAQIPTLWNEVSQFIETDMTLADVLGLAPTALQLDSSRIHSLVFNPWYIQEWTTPGGDAVLLPVADRVELMVQELYIPPTQNTLVQEQARIEILNGTANEDWDEVAAARLAWEGFVPVASGQNGEFLADTMIYDYTGQTKGSSLNKIAEVLNVRAEGVVVQPDPNRTVDYRVILGASYNSCTYNVPPPVPTPTPEPETGG